MINYENGFEPIAEINLQNLYHNMSYVKDNLGKEKLICVVKSDAYGHGLEIAKYMEKWADGFAVSKVEEGVRLRFLGISKPIMLLTLTGGDDVMTAINYNVTVLVDSLKYLNYLLQNYSSDILINLKVDTGMNRLGFKDLNEFESSLKIVAKNKKIRLCGVYSHFFDSQSFKNCKNQYNEFKKFLSVYDKFFDGDRHISASGGFLHKKFNLDAVRIGILLYGYAPYDYKADVLPVMKIYANPVKRATFSACDKCLYNSKVCEGEYSLVNYGYADGAFRNCLPVRCMDLSYVANRSERVTVLDDANLLAKENNTIPYEILVNATKRIKKIYVGDV